MAFKLKICVPLALLLLGFISCQELDLNERISDAVEGKERVKNVLKLLSLNAHRLVDWESDEGEDMNEVLCDVVKNLNPPLIGLQQLPIPQWLALNRCFDKLKKCYLIKNRDGSSRPQCDKYSLIGSSNTNSGKIHFNPVIFKETRHLRRMKNGGGENGTFWLSKTPRQAFTGVEGAAQLAVCSWVKLRFAMDTSPKEVGEDIQFDNPFFETLYKVLKSKPKKDKRRTTKWVDFYFLNTQLDASIEVASKQMQILLNYVKENFDAELPVIFTGGRKSDDNSGIRKLLVADGFENAATGARNVDNRNPQPESEMSFIWTKGINNMVYTATYGELEAQLAAMMFQ